MRLINTLTFELRDFGAQPPLYAILSHTWGEDEVTFHDMADLDTARKKQGFAKIEQCCRQALRDGLSWAWVDTCCIDKTSSAELSETINSMFKWYERAMKCYAFLSEVNIRPRPGLFSDQGSGGALVVLVQDHLLFFSARWWTRGWTLQELIAPHDVEFYNRDWEYLTSKRSWKRFMSNAIGIAEPVLDHSKGLASVCVAERMSWAAGRDTTRGEDLAYCLLGILDVNMPLLYGEGASKAFLRLQQHVVAATEDYSLFLWGGIPLLRGCRVCFVGPLPNLLAGSPSDFRRGQGQLWSRWAAGGNSPALGEPPQLTSRGLRVSLFIRHVTKQDVDGSSPLSSSLRYFVTSLLQSPFQDFLERLRSAGIALERGLFFAAFPCFTTGPSPVLPCLLLLDLDILASVNGETRRPVAIETGIRTYGCMMFFFHALLAADLDAEWQLRTCYIQSSPNSEGRHPGALFSLLHAGDDFWFWRPAHRDGLSRLEPGKTTTIFHEGWKNGARLRRILHLEATEAFPGCIIMVAARPGSFWLHHRTGRDIDPEAEAERLQVMDLSGMWVETAREVGPLGEVRVDFGTESLLATLFLEKNGSVEEWYRVYLAIIERGTEGSPSGRPATGRA
ncbi:heterokaryon incompatibility protein-domain-containing protein [Parachaetomium inaequale]|uniref:Heterokaryon incompatibility protein-domain-containing protein n=1 Tax=Parachaetomium inaequale TaxID=2588326 RepID=A0AAN6PK74_9PEZI|nr:heterokaryon incompatibility protein-domain-containing protein [Parachaetomium inaequale]